MKSLKYAYLLPVGTVVKVKDVEQRLMIFGVLQKGGAIPGRIFDYIAVPYPMGLQDMRLNIGFDHENIEEIYSGDMRMTKERHFWLFWRQWNERRRTGSR